MATALSCSTTSRLAVLPSGITTSSIRTAVTAPSNTRWLDVTENSGRAVVAESLISDRPTYLAAGRPRTVVAQASSDGSSDAYRFGHGFQRCHFILTDRQPLGFQVIQRGSDERREQRMRSGRSRLEFRVRLGGDQERMLAPVEFDELDQ